MSEPGWYQDPSDPMRLRLWDGSSWTDQTQPRGPDVGEPLAAVAPQGGDPIPAAPRPPSRSRWALVAVGVVAVVSVVAAIAIRSTNESPATGELAGDGSGDLDDLVAVELEAFDATGPEPFTESVAADTPPVTAGGVPGLSEAPGTVQRLPGSTPGLFAGTGDPALCDLESLQRQLAADPQRATAFAAAVSVPTESIESWLENLTPVILREDTRVTSHRYRNGEPDPVASVLQAGTAVAVDRFGTPRIRCVSGSPLLDAQPAASEYVGTAWNSFSTKRITAVAPADAALDSFALTDLTTGVVFDQPAGLRTVVSDRSIMGVRFGASEAEAMTRFTEVLGPPTDTERFPCPESADERVNHFWGPFAVRFERDRLDAWIATESTLGQFPRDPGGLGLSPRLLFTPVTPGVSVAGMSDALDLARDRDPTSWLTRATDSGLFFSDLGSQWLRFVSAERTASDGPVGVGFRTEWTSGDPATAQLVSVIATGTYPSGERRPQVCFGSDVAF